MFYCFYRKELDSKEERHELERQRAKLQKEFIYYDPEQKEILNQDDQKIDLTNQEVLPVSGVLQLREMLTCLKENNALLPNTEEEINKIEEWYKYIETKRNLYSFVGKQLNDTAYLTYLYESLSDSTEVFLKTKNKDFNGVVALEEFFDPTSDLRKAFSYHPDDEFILAKKITIDKDELGNREYRSIIKEGKIMNISRITDTTYHRIEKEVLVYITKVLAELPEEFPNTFVLDVFSYDNTLDIVELNPLEASGKYLYNTIFETSSDLLHQDITNVPEEKKYLSLSYESSEELTPSTIVNVQNTFAKDYDDVKRFGERQSGYIHISGLSTGTKINLQEFFSDITLVTEEDDLKRMSQASKEKVKIK